MALAAALALTACAEDSGDDDAASVATTDSDTQAPETEDAEEDEPEGEAPQSEQFTIAGTGDVLIHDNVIDEAAALADEEDYAFAPLMAGVKDLIDGADLALCGLEVPIAPEGVEPVGYPVFAAPPELTEDLASVGFHGCSTANNHSFDQGVPGQERTLEVFDEAGLGHSGTARTAEEADQPQLYTLERGGREVTVAHLATTMVHNDAYPPPEDEPWRVTDVSANELTELAGQAREDGADIVVASVHWGTEYVHEPTAEQREYGEELAAGGEIDAVFGGHSHTPQPVEQLEGGPRGEDMWVVWSMGNFLSNQDEACCVPETASGTVVYATVEVDDDAAEVIAMDWLPVTVDRGPTDDEPHRGIWPLRDLSEGATPEGVELSEETVQDRWARMLEVMTDQTLREEPPSPTGEEPIVEPRGD
jgi:poly-gamma-glutamate capsule biosynthesis protein CapA/YwtB (metallophosphatase superfamily)